MSHLPGTCENQNNDLRNAVPHSPGISRLAQISEIGLSFTLVLLFSSDLLEFCIKVADLCSYFGHVGAIVVEVWASFTHYNVEIEADVGRRREPCRLGEVGREADVVVARVVRRESEAAIRRPASVHQGIRRFDFVDLDLDAQARIVLVLLLCFVPFESPVVSFDDCICWQLFDETSPFIDIQVEM